VNPQGGFNSYWEMPFRTAARITIESLADQDVILYYQIDYTLTTVLEDAAYFHAQRRRSNPLLYKEVHTLLDDIRSSGHYVGTYIAWGVHNAGWWGEGEIKFYLDSDQDYPTICGTGTEDYFGVAWNFDVPGQGYTPFTTPFLGLNQVLRPDGLYQSQQRFGLYHWHIMDPIRFQSDLRVTIQALGWRADRRYLPLQDFHVARSNLSSTMVSAIARENGSVPALRSPPLIRWSASGWSRSSRCNGRRWAHTSFSKYARRCLTRTGTTDSAPSIRTFGQRTYRSPHHQPLDTPDF